jgi:hypothetical protein
MMHYKETKYGFEYGSARVERTCSDNKKGWIVLTIITPRKRLQVYVTKTGLIKSQVAPVPRVA